MQFTLGEDDRQSPDTPENFSGLTSWGAIKGTVTVVGEDGFVLVGSGFEEACRERFEWRLSNAVNNPS